MILCVDDEPVNLTIMEELLQDSYDLGTAKSGEQCLEQVAAAIPDLILLDVNMPRMNGKEALRAIKADPALCAIPVAMITTSGSAAEIRECFDLGACSYLQKPLHFDAFVTKLESFLNYWTQVSELPARHTTDHG